MKVILNADVKGTGKKGEIVNSGSVNELLEEYCQPSLEDVYLDLFGDDEDVTVD